MRRFLISLLLASAAAAPALAEPPKDREQTREERQQAREERQQSREESRPERVQVERVQVERVQPQSQVRQQAVDRSDRSRTLDRGNGGNAQSIRDSIEARRDERAETRQDRIEARELRQSTRPVPNVMRNRVPVVSNVPKPGTQPPLRVDNRPTSTPSWSTNWRHNSKYDWYNWRKRNRSLFHLGYYYDPFGWGYQPYSIGWRLWPSYYSSRYWLNDPWQYRLPYAPPGYRWVRYWNDAVLVDTWTGQVVDVLYNFFW